MTYNPTTGETSGPPENPNIALDESIVEVIRDGVDRFGNILVRMSHQEPERALRSGFDRLVDRRLQHLRKKNRIEYVNGKWRIKSGTAC